ncbi:MAG: phosphoenolpyruvate--protein phosphotransferase [Anaerolineales bacterium]|nr:phosphoenolpyruvate--protein phosphotransferase [Anaerolineales bacterium]
MVGIVIVSHSARLAAGVHELAEQMVQGKVPLASAGGIDDLENPIGTDAMQVYAAIESVYSDDGVVVLMDLGSALLSAEIAVEFLPVEQQSKVVLSAAPLVEGTLAAAIQSSVGGTRDQVLAEAQNALTAKQAQLPGTQPEETTAVSSPTPPIKATHEISLTIPNPQGLHARPAAQFVTTANQFAAEIQVHKADKQANAKSINQVATLGVRQGDVIVVKAVGDDAEDALTALQTLAAANFGESFAESNTEVVSVTAVSQASEGVIIGIPASPGIAIGPVFLYRPHLPEIVVKQVADSDVEWNRLETAVDKALAEVNALYLQAVKQVGQGEAAIFEAHALFLQDPSLLQAAKAILFDQQINAEAAWQQAIMAQADQYRTLDDAYMQARAADIEDVGNRVLRQLLDVETPALDFAEPSILIAADLTPSDTARMDPQRVLGICTELGGATSHSAILARALGIPALVGLGPDLRQLMANQIVIIDGEAGQLWTQTNAEQLVDFQQRRETWLAAQTTAKAASQATAVTRDDHQIEIAANIGSPNDIPVVKEFGAEGIGLFRTEFLFMGRETAPTVEEQYGAYKRVAEQMGAKPVIIRTLDVGGDKPLPYLGLAQEDNPFLGWRGIRFCLDRPDIFKPQLEAILRAGYGHNLKLMFPMVGSLGEIRAAKALLVEVQAELAATGIPHAADMEIGMMIEVPAAVAIADQLAAEVDFFSIGTNDLTQYTMAADRGNAKVSELVQALQPAVLRLIKQTVDAGHAAGIWVGMCGELAGNPLATAVLVGLGLDELSMSAPAIPVVKAAIRRLGLAEAQAVADVVLGMGEVTAVVDYLSKLIPE